MYFFNCFIVFLIMFVIEICISTSKSPGPMEPINLNYFTQVSESPTRRPIQKLHRRHKNKTYERDGFDPFTFNPKRRERPTTTTTTTRTPLRISQNEPELMTRSTNSGRNSSYYSDLRKIILQRQRSLKSYDDTLVKLPDLSEFRNDMEKTRQKQTQRTTKKFEWGFWPALVVLSVIIFAGVKMIAFLVTNCLTPEGEQNNELSHSEGEIHRIPEHEHRVTDASVVGITYPEVLVQEQHRQPLPNVVREPQQQRQRQQSQRPQPFDQELQQLQEIRQRIDSEEEEARQEQRDMEALQQLRYLQHLLADNGNSSSRRVVFVGVDVHDREREHIHENNEREGRVARTNADADAPPCYNEIESAIELPPPPRYEDLNNS